jgi:hypothetical protein
VVELTVIESAHRTNIERLVSEFGENYESEITELYVTQRKAEENSARITDFTPIFTYRTVRDFLMEILGEKSSERYELSSDRPVPIPELG